MRNEQLEKSVNKIDNNIAALKIAKKFLSNTEEINGVIEDFNRNRQELVNELYVGDHQSYEACYEDIEEMLDKELGKEEQVELLEMIKDYYGRQAPDVSKKSSGLNAWLKELNLEYEWIENEESDWATLVITGFGPYKTFE